MLNFAQQFLKTNPMGNILCTLKDGFFKTKAKQLNLSEAALERIVHNYINEKEDPEAFPSDSYIKAQYAIENIVPEADIEALTTVWENNFSSPVTVASLEEAVLLKDKASKYFKDSAISIQPLHNGDFRVTVASPRLATSKKAEGSKGSIVYNDEQVAAIETAVKHINDVRAGKTKQRFFTIQGKAGTGKTTIVNEILSRMNKGTYNRPIVIMGALSHKATTVLKEKIAPEVAKSFELQNKTIAGMLGMRPTNEGTFEPVPGKTPPIQFASVVFIDEASMVDEEQLELIQNTIKNKSISIIFLGDKGQLPPVRTSRYYARRKIPSDKLSPVFEDESIPKVELVTRVRQGEDSPVLDYADRYWNFSQGKSDKYPNDLHAKSRVTDRGALIVQRNEIDLVEQLLPLFKEAKKTGNPNLVKIVPYTTNNTDSKVSAVDKYNERIRKALYPDATTDGFMVGDLIIFNDTFGDDMGTVPNSFESSVVTVRPCESSLPYFEGLELEEVEREYLSIRGPQGTFTVPALVPTGANKAKHHRNLSKIANYCKANKKEWPKFWSYKNNYAANIGYAYAIDSHKSQGSTYEVVAVDAADINSVQPTTLKTKAQSIYTALTRASNVTIVSSNTTNESTVYTDIQGINDRINSVKNGTAGDSEFTPAMEEEDFAEVTEDDIDKLIEDPNKNANKVKKKGDIVDEDYNPVVKSDADVEYDEDEGDSWDDDDSFEDEDDTDDKDDEPAPAKVKKETPQQKTYREFVAAQKQLNSIIKFKKNSHSYFINGRKADYSVTEFRDFVFGKNRDSNDYLEVSSRLGDTHDAFLRDYFAGALQDSYPNLNEARMKKLEIQAAKLEALLVKTYGEDAIFITDEDLLRTAGVVKYEGKEYVVAGTMDMAVIDSKGDLHIVDFKTKRANISEELDEEKVEEYAFQVSMYKAFQASNPLFRDKVGKAQIAQFNLKYASPDHYEYSFKGDQIYIELGGKPVRIEDAVREGKTPYSTGVFNNKLRGLSVDLEAEGIEVSQLKTDLQKGKEHKEVAEKTRTEPKRFEGKMVEFYGKEKRDDVRAASTMGAILEGKRTATTRWQPQYREYWKKVKVGDIITFTDKNGKTVDVRATVPLHKLTLDTDPEEWSKKEGWSVDFFNKVVLPKIKKGEAYQMEYELIEEDKSSIEINSKSKKYGVLSNFGAKEFEVDGKTFPTVEHYFQWAKAVHCKNFAMANRIKNASSAAQAKYFGSHQLEMTKAQQASWDKFSRKVMKKGMREAFEQNDEAKDLLLSTGTALLTHYLGGPFADILMELREEFGGAGKPSNAKEIEKQAKEEAKKRKEVPEAPSKREKGTTPKGWIRRGDKQVKISTEGYKKGDPQDNPDVAYVFTENAQAAAHSHGNYLDFVTEDGEFRPKLNVSDVKGTNQAGIRTDSKGNKTENAFGVVVKKRQQDKDGNLLKQEGTFQDTESDFNLFKSYNERFFKELDESGLKKIVFPSQMALGKAALPKRFAEWLANGLNSRYGVVATVKETTTSGYGGYGLSIDSIQEKKVDSSLHIEKISDRYTPKTSSDVEQFNTAAEALRKQGWHVEFYSKKSKDGSITNDVMTISIEGNPKKGFFELVKDAEENSYSVHFKTKSKKAMNESEFAEEALEDSEKEDMFKALIYAIPEGGTVSTWGTLSKGGIAALDNLARRSNGVLAKIGDKLAKDTDGNEIRIPVYSKLSEDEIAEANISKVKKAQAVRKETQLDQVSEGFFGIEESTDKDDRFTSIVKLTIPKIATGVIGGHADAAMKSQIQALPYSTLVSLDTSVVNMNFLYALDELLKNPSLHVVPTETVITIDPESAEGLAAKEYAKKGKRLQYDAKTGELKVPMFTTGYSIKDIEKRAAYNRLINNDLLTQEELRALSKATMYKTSEFLTMIQSTSKGYKKIFGKETDKDFTKMTRIQIIEKIGLKNLMLEIRERIFNSRKRSPDTATDTLDKLDIIYDNWNAFVELGYDILIGLEEIAMDSNQNHKEDIKNDLNTNNEDSEDVVQELFGSSIEHWQVGFRQVSAFSSLSKMIKRTMDSLYELDENGEKIYDEYGLAKHLDAQAAVSKILHFTQGAQSLDDINADGTLKSTSMLAMLKSNLNAEPWIQEVLDLLEDHYDAEGNLTKKADEQFKAQFYSNFKKYFQKYCITFKDKSGKVLVKTINESQYADTLLKECQAKENSFALNGFRLKTKEGAIKQEALKALKDAASALSDFAEKAESKGKIAELVDLKTYHKTLEDIFNLLDIDTSSKESLYNLFSVKRNLKELNRHLEYLIPKIKDGVTITDDRDYKQIVALAAKEMGLEMESVSYESGKMYYSYVLPSYLGRLTTNLKGTNMTKEEYQEFLQKEYLRYEWFNKNGTKVRCHWLDRLKRSEEARRNLEHTTSLHYLGTDYSSKSPVEYIASMMRMYFYDNNKKWAYFRVPMLSNKPSEEYIKFERISTGFKDTIARYMFDIFTQELDRIQAVRERKENIGKDQKIVSKGKKETFDTRGETFVFEDYLNKYKDGTYKNRPEYKALTDKEKAEEDEFSRLLNAKLNGTISEESADYGKLITLFKTMTNRAFEENYQVARQQWVDEGFLTLNPDGTIKSIADGLKLSEEDLREFFWNDAFAATQILELTITDVAYYVDTEDLQKRLAQIHAPGMQAYIKAKDKNGNLYTKDGIERTMYIKDDMVKSTMLSNLKKARELIILDTPKERRQYVARQLDGIIKAFEKINFADAQGYSCPSSYRKKMGIFGNWDDRMEEAYEKVTHPEKYPDTNLSDMLDVLWQPLKPFVYTQIAKPGYNDVLPELKVSVQNKNSEYVLVMADALLQRAGVPNKLRAIYEFMEDSQHNLDGTLNGEGIDTIQFMSAVNAGCTGVIDLNDTVNKDGSITYKTEDEVKELLGKAYEIGEDGSISYSSDYVHEIPFEDYIIQQNVPAHFMKHEQAHGSQDRILTFADMLDIDPLTGDTNYLIIDGEKVSVADAKKRYFDAIATNIEDSKKELVKRFKLDNSDPRAVNVAISKVLKDTILKDSRYGSDLLWACDTNEYGEFNIPLSDPIHSNRIQQLLNSIIKNTINKQEIAGGPVVQVSNWGTSDRLNIRFKNDEGQLLLTEKEFVEEDYPKDYDKTDRDGKRKWQAADDYDTYEEYIEYQAGVAYFEAFVPIPDENFAKDFMKKDANGNEYIDVEEIEKMNPDLLFMIGYRIPTESKYSMVPIKVKGFLPRVGGEGVMLPADITSLAGSDFDIDKEYIMKYTFYRIEKDGKVTYEKPKKGRGYRNNLIISTQLAVLQSEQVQKQLFTPGNFDEPKRLGYLISYVQNESARTGRDPEEIWDEAIEKGSGMSVDDFNDWLKDMNKAPKNLIFNNVQVQFHKQNMTAGKLIGIFAQANVSHAFISLKEDTTLIIPSGLSFKLNGVNVGENFLIDDILTRDRSVNISNNLASLLAASVDAVKDPVLNLINININTANMVTSVLRMGFSLETVSLLASQPVIKDLVKDYAIKGDDIGELIREKLDDMPADVQQISDIAVTDRDLIANLNGDSVTTNYMVLKIFSKMQDISDTFGDITHMTRYNSITSAVGPFASDTMLQRTKDEAFRSNEMISEPVKEACDNPILYAFREYASDVERNLLGTHLIQAGTKFRVTLDALGETLGYGRGVPSKVANALSDFYMSFYVNDSGNGEGSVFDLSYENRKRVLTQFPKDFLRLKKKYKDNILINSIQYVESDREQYPFLQLKTRGLNSTVLEDIKNAWISLYNDPTSRDLALSLVEYNYFRGSFGFSPKTFMSLVPNVVKNNLNNYINVLNNRDSRVESLDRTDRIIRQFILHNPKLIINRYRKLENYNPTDIVDDVYGECIEVTRKSEKDDKEKYTLKASRPFVKIDDNTYFVVRKELDTLVLKKVDELGGEGQGFEISTEEDFPKSIFDSSSKATSKESKKSDDDGGSFKKDNLDKESLGILIEQLFESDDELESLADLKTNKAIDKINKAASEAGYDIKLSQNGKTVKKVMAVLDKIEGVSNPREILNAANTTIDNLNLCS